MLTNSGEIIGYSTVKKESENECNINLIAISKDHQANGLGAKLLLRTLEKMNKIGCKLTTLEFRDREKLINYYNSPKIPYEKKFERDVGSFKDGEAKHKITYILTNRL